MRSVSLAWAVSVALIVPSARSQEAQAPFQPPRSLGPVETYGRHIARTMATLASATPDYHPPVRILFYGQSITEQEWAKTVADDLRRRYPNAHLVIENRAIGGHSSQLLVKTAEADLYPFQPDLVIFHVYGSHIDYETIIRRIRERTTAEILMQTDHLARDDKLDEPTDPAGLGPRGDIWPRFMNYVFLPETAREYGAELANVRGLWKQYLADHQLEPAALLKDGVHLNDRGNALMAEFIKAYLRETPGVSDNPAAGTITTYAVGKDLAIADQALALEFEGNRVDAVLETDGLGAVTVRIDGKAPSEFPEVSTTSRVAPYPGSNWPCLLKVGHESGRVPEPWTLTLTELGPEFTTGRFRIAGSVTGPDGEGTLEERFVSKSGRVVIEPGDWNLGYCLRVFGKRIEPGFAITWSDVLQGTDEIGPATSASEGSEPTVTLAMGLPPGKHRLELTGPGLGRMRALRVYRPPLWGKTEGAAAGP